MQAYFFELGADTDRKVAPLFEVRQAKPSDVGVVAKECGDFFTDVAKQIEKGEIFVTLRDSIPVGVGVRQLGEFNPRVASIGMFTFEAFRQSGVGVGTITSLIALCRSHGIRPVAGCWYYNHASKKTLERAGMVAPTRLLRVLY
jgi:hypothetical protein